MPSFTTKIKSLKPTSQIFIIAILLWGIFLTHSAVRAYQVSEDSAASYSATRTNNSEPVTAAQPFALQNFQGIELRIPATLNWTPSPASQCTVNRELEGLYLTIKENTLIISLKRKITWRRQLPKNIIFNCSSPSLEFARIEGAGKMTIDNLDTPRLRAVINGSGELKAGGSTHSLNGEINGTGKMQLQHLTIHFAQLQINGMGEFLVPQAKEVDVEINGMGSVEVSGATKVIRKEINGMGSVDVTRRQ